MVSNDLKSVRESGPIKRISARSRGLRASNSGRRYGRTELSGAQALVWLSPALILVLGVVLYPAIALVIASGHEYSITGVVKGPVGLRNFVTLFDLPDLWRIIGNTIYWVVVVVLFTIVLSLGLAQLLEKKFAGRRLLRWVVLLPWAASLIITSRLFQLLYDYHYGALNALLLKIGVISAPVDWLGDPSFTMTSMIVVGVFVSLPFTAYVFLSGLNSIPVELYEAARIDGASAIQTYFKVTLPLLRDSIMIAVVLNAIYVFNSFPIVWTLNERNPGTAHDILVTYAYRLAFTSADRDVGVAAAASLVNVLLIIIIILIYLWSNHRLERDRRG